MANTRLDDFGKQWDAATVAGPEPLQIGRRVTIADVLQMAQQEAAKMRAEHAAEIARLNAALAEGRRRENDLATVLEAERVLTRQLTRELEGYRPSAPVATTGKVETSWVDHLSCPVGTCTPDRETARRLWRERKLQEWADTDLRGLGGAF